MDGAAVLDKETGLVWEREPSGNWLTSLGWAMMYCNNLAIGGRKGWRLPSVQELESLVDWSNYEPPLPSGHPFINVKFDWRGDNDPNSYWTTTPHSQCFFPDGVSIVNFTIGNVLCTDKTEIDYFWCVRGGQNKDADILLWTK